MEFAIWNEIKYSALEISKDYLLEKQIRKASSKELLCPDPDCKFKKLRYCNGEYKIPYFAHISTEDCDYAKFDAQNNNSTRLVAQKLYDILKAAGYEIEREIKLLNHYYTHLLLKTPAQHNLAIQFGTTKLTADKIEQITTGYIANQINFQWIILGDINITETEQKIYFSKRFVLNEMKNNTLIVIDKTGTNVVQCKLDTNRYTINEVPIKSSNYPEIFQSFGKMEDLCYIDEQLTLPNFQKDFDVFMEKKTRAFEKKKSKFYKTQNSSVLSKASACTNQNFHNSITYTNENQKSTESFNQQEYQVFDSSNRRLIKCEFCGRIDQENNFVSYGGINHMNLGTCNICDKRNKT